MILLNIFPKIWIFNKLLYCILGIFFTSYDFYQESTHQQAYLYHCQATMTSYDHWQEYSPWQEFLYHLQEMVNYSTNWKA